MLLKATLKVVVTLSTITIYTNMIKVYTSRIWYIDTWIIRCNIYLFYVFCYLMLFKIPFILESNTQRYNMYLRYVIITVGHINDYTNQRLVKLWMSVILYK